MNITRFATLLKQKRNALNLSQSKVAELCFLSKSSYNHYERGTRLPTLETLTASERETEKLMMHLRLLNHGYPIQNLPPQGVQTALQNHWIIQKDNMIFPTLEGTLLLNSLILLLMPT